MPPRRICIVGTYSHSAGDPEGRLLPDGPVSCASCQAIGGCGLALFRRSPRNAPIPRGTVEPAALRRGQRLRAEVPANSLVVLALACFLLPAVLMTAGAGLAEWLVSTGGDGPALAGALAALLLGCSALRLYDSRFGAQWVRDRLLISGSVESTD